jgi:nucleotide-binding universal stress UspA family protein
MSTILVGVDASERSRDAIAFARQLAAASGAGLVLATVFLYEEQPSRISSRDFRRLLEEDALALVQRLRDEIGDPGIRTAVTGRGSSAHGLHDLAQAENADLLVVGSSHVGALGRVLPGSTAERLLHGATCPVAVVPRGYEPGAGAPARIGVGYDGSDESEIALTAAAEVARATGARLRVIRALNLTAYTGPGLIGTAYVVPDELESRERDDLAHAIRDLPDGVLAEPLFATGDPVKELARESETLDLLVTGSRGYGPLHAVLTGGVTGPLLRAAHCPVVVLPRGVQSPLGELFATAPAAA